MTEPVNKYMAEMKTLFLEAMEGLKTFYETNKKILPNAELKTAVKEKFRETFPSSSIHHLEKNDITVEYDRDTFENRKQLSEFESELDHWFQQIKCVNKAILHISDGTSVFPVFVTEENYLNGDKTLFFTSIHIAGISEKCTFLTVKKTDHFWQTEPWGNYRVSYLDYVCKIFEKVFED